MGNEGRRFGREQTHGENIAWLSFESRIDMDWRESAMAVDGYER
jgi:hypothetical protein